ncbi:MAG: thioredoxin [Gracilibacter sp. BRH_c7a]|nr:MAG: thioredoxin [Gracilibacter sp. BRH_c7a]
MCLCKLNNADFENVIYDSGESCLVIFSRQSCHVCQDIIPVLEDMKPKYEGKFGFYYVDVEDQKSIFNRFTLKGVPQILFFKDGEYQGKLAGVVDEEKVANKIADIL